MRNTGRGQRLIEYRLQVAGDFVSNVNRSPLVVIAGGGTGGHLFPAMAVADAISKRIDNVRFVFFGSRRAIDSRILKDTGWELVPQPLVGMTRLPWQWPGVVRGVRASVQLAGERFDSDRPSLVLGTGGMSSFPAMREAIRRRIPTAMLNPDAKPGRANRILAGSVDRVFVQWAQSVRYFPNPECVEVSGCPVRSTCWKSSREAGIQHFDLDSSKKTLLVTGASQGARSINQAVLANLEFLERQRGWQILHLTGQKDFQEVQQAYSGRSVCSSVHPFTDQMGKAYAIADLVIARAGAATLAEITAVGLASVLLPYPFHRDRHQEFNARCLSDAPGGAAAMLLIDRIQSEKNAPELLKCLRRLMEDDSARSAMAELAGQTGCRDAATFIAAKICQTMHVPSCFNHIDSLEQRSTDSR